jgi:hypothetical protein
MIKVDGDKSQDCFHQDVKSTLAIPFQLLTLSALDFNSVHHLPHTLLAEKDSYYLLDGNRWIPNALRRIESSGDLNALQCCPLLIEKIEIPPYRLVS